MSEFVTVCSGCSLAIEQSQKFVAKKDADGKWDVRHEGCIDLGSDLETLPRFMMTPARAWVLSR